ncbi:MAG: hypothetical protein ACE37J_15935 [Pikeienuella sp.]|uniref:hypothetical protein n=1 Tax=Pikeienuella sp. TaxID=2831957 RepID=UPI00391D7EAB
MQTVIDFLFGQSETVNLVLRTFGLLLGLPALFWSLDKLLLSPAGRKAIWAALADRFVRPEGAFAIYHELLGPPGATARFVLVTLAFSVASILIFLLGFAFLAPQFAESFLTSGIARAYYLRQFLTEGVLTVFLVNYVALQIMFALEARLSASGLGLWPALLADMALRVALFAIGLSAVYFASAPLFGSFGGDPAAGLRAVLPTLAAGLRLEAVTSVYFYAAAISGLPLFLAAVLDLMRRWPPLGAVVRALFFYLPVNENPILAGAATLGVFLALLSSVASAAFG